MAGDDELEGLREHRRYCWSQVKQHQEWYALGMISSYELREQSDKYYFAIQDADRQIAQLQDPGMTQKLELLARLQGTEPQPIGYLTQGTEVVDDGMHERYHVGKAEVTRTVDIHAFIEPTAPSGMPPYWRYDVDPTPSFVYNGNPKHNKESVYRNTVLELEEKIKTYHWASKTYSDDNPLQQVRAKGIMQLDERYKELCDELGYEYLNWKCTDGRNGEAVVYYERPPREIVDELFTEVTGLNPEDTYDGWREAFIKTGLMSALEHMKEHVR